MRGVVRSLVTRLLHIFSWFWLWNNYENRLLFGKVKAYSTISIYRCTYVFRTRVFHPCESYLRFQYLHFPSLQNVQFRTCIFRTYIFQYLRFQRPRSDDPSRRYGHLKFSQKWGRRSVVGRRGRRSVAGRSSIFTSSYTDLIYSSSLR